MFIASCPECGDSLTFPSGVALSSRCRCPLCTETFTLEECLSELPPMAELLDGEAGGGGYSPAYGGALSGGGGTALATAPRTATASSPRVGSATAGSRAGAGTGRAPARKSKGGGNPILQMAQVIVGGAVGVGLAVLIIWWGLGKDPFNLAPTVAEYAPFLVPAKFKSDFVPVSTQGEPKSVEGQQDPLPKDASGGVKLDTSRFGLDNEQPQPNPGRNTRSSLDPAEGELSEEPVVESFSPDLDTGGSFGALEEPSLDSFALPDSDLAPEATPTEGAPDAFATDPAAEKPMVDAPEEGAFSLEPFAADPGSTDLSFSGDPGLADPAASTNDPFALVFPTATEDLADAAAAEAEAWAAYSTAKAESAGQPSALKESAEKHYEQLAALAQIVTGLPSAPRSNAAVAELTAKLSDRFAAPDDWRIANFLARTRLTEVDFGLSGVIVVGRVDAVEPEGELAVLRLTSEQGANEKTKQVVAVVRESQGVPEVGSIVVALGVKHAGPVETLPAALSEEKAPIILAGAVAPVGGEPAAEETPATEPADTEPAPTEPSATEPAPTDPAPGEPAAETPAPTEPTGDEPAPAEPSTEDPAPGEPAPAEPESTDPSTEEPSADPAPEEPAPSEEGSGEEPAPAAPNADS